MPLARACATCERGRPVAGSHHAAAKTEAMKIADVPVFILCGGLGTRLKEMSEFRPKPMIPLGRDPILFHIMKYYGSFGFDKFVLCMGYKSEVIREYFLNFFAMNSDATIDLRTNAVEVHRVDHSHSWKVALAYTGEATMTGGRAYFPQSPKDFAPIYREIASALRHEYVLGTAPAHDAQFHSLSVEILGGNSQPLPMEGKKAVYRVFARQGYLAPQP